MRRGASAHATANEGRRGEPQGGERESGGVKVAVAVAVVVGQGSAGRGWRGACGACAACARVRVCAGVRVRVCAVKAVARLRALMAYGAHRGPPAANGPDGALTATADDAHWPL